MDKAKMTFAEADQLFEAREDFELALCAMLRAKDSRGLKLRLYSGPHTARGLRDALRELTSAPFSADRVEYISYGSAKGIDSELTFARHLQLLTNAYVKGLECEALEKAKAYG